MPKQSARERILDAYQDILISGGVAAVTLEAVADAASVSKGGLLYHFGTKDALREGLLDRMRRLYDEDLAAAVEAPEGVVRHYLETSITDATTDAAMNKVTLAITPLAMADPDVAAVVRQCNARWRDLLAEHVDDPLGADLLAVVGDGLYLRAAIGDDSAALRPHWDEIVRRLTGPHHTPTDPATGGNVAG